MLDHIGLSVENYDAMKQFYSDLLPTLGYELVMEATEEQTEAHKRACGFGPKGKPALWISDEGKNTPRLHIALLAENRAAVDTFYKKALELGAHDNGAPGLRPHYHPHYYGAFIIDPEGHNVEAVCHTPE